MTRLRCIQNNLFAAAAPTLFFCLIGCSGQGIQPQIKPVSPPEIARYLCQYHRGAFLNWQMYPEYQEFLEPGEVSAVAYVSERLRNEIALSGRPKQLAVAQFLAKTIECEPQDPLDGQMESDGTLTFVFNQKIPSVPNVPDPPPDSKYSDSEATRYYLDEFVKNRGTDFTNHPVIIGLRDVGGGKYVLKSRIADTYAMDLHAQSIKKNLMEGRINAAHKEFSELCSQPVERCNRLNAEKDLFERVWRESQEKFERNVEVGEISYKYVASGRGGDYTVAHFILTNHGEDVFREIIFVTEEPDPQHCVLQGIQTRRGDSPVELGAGQSMEVWCALSPDTLPSVKLKFYGDERLAGVFRKAK